MGGDSFARKLIPLDYLYPLALCMIKQAIQFGSYRFLGPD